VRLVGFIKKKSITMHGNMNVKLPGSAACRAQIRFRYSCEGILNSLHYLHKFFLPTTHTAVGISDIYNVHNTKYVKKKKLKKYRNSGFVLIRSTSI
jgi:hypothetical protein